jgi:hypothetical protein
VVVLTSKSIPPAERTELEGMGARVLSKDILGRDEVRERLEAALAGAGLDGLARPGSARAVESA